MTSPTRLERLQAELRSLGVDGFLVTELHNVRYLTGFTGDSTYLLVMPQDAVLLSDRRYEDQLALECPGIRKEIRGPGKTMQQLMLEAFQAASITRMGIEEEHVSWSMYKKLVADLRDVKWQGLAGVVEKMRSRKDAAELAILRRAVRLAESAFQKTIAELTPDWTEQQVAWRLEHWVREGGGEKLGFPAIVASGPAAAHPHYHPHDTRIGNHPLLLIDWGAKLDGYISDLTRVVCLGPLSQECRRIHEVTLAAHDAAIAAIAPGKTFEEIDAAARGVIESAGYGDRFSHGLGHGIGLQVHEHPRMAAGQKGILEPGMVITVEPGIYLPGVAGVRIEDDCLVTETGHEVLSRLTTGLERVGQV